MKAKCHPLFRDMAVFFTFVAVLFAPQSASSNPRDQTFEVSYAVRSTLDLDSTYMRSKAEILVRLVDSVPCHSIQLSCRDGLIIDTVMVDEVRLDSGSLHADTTFFRYDLAVPLPSPMLVGQSRTLSLSYRCKVQRKEIKKGVLGLGGTIPLVTYIRRLGPMTVQSGDGRYFCRANFDYRLTVTPPTFAVGEGELLNESELSLAPSNSNDTVLSDMIPDIQFPSKPGQSKLRNSLNSRTYSWRKEQGIDFSVVLLTDYTLDRTWVGSAQVDLYYPRKSKERWAAWAVPVIADAVRECLDKRNWGPYPFNFVVAQVQFTTGKPPIIFLPNKKLNAIRLRELVSSYLENFVKNVVL
jgi:hypothetical protein